jgi:hypothetical protein
LRSRIAEGVIRPVLISLTSLCNAFDGAAATSTRGISLGAKPQRKADERELALVRGADLPDLAIGDDRLTERLPTARMGLPVMREVAAKFHRLRVVGGTSIQVARTSAANAT